MQGSGVGAAEEEWRLSTNAFGCHHCVSCSGERNADEELWPAGAQSPTIYFIIKRIALAKQIRNSRPGNAYVWHQSHHGMGSISILRSRRQLSQLCVQVPVTRTNVSAKEGVEFLGEVSLSPREGVPVAAATAGSSGRDELSDSSSAASCSVQSCSRMPLHDQEASIAPFCWTMPQHAAHEPAGDSRGGTDSNSNQQAWRQSALTSVVVCV